MNKTRIDKDRESLYKLNKIIVTPGALLTADRPLTHAKGGTYTVHTTSEEGVGKYF